VSKRLDAPYRSGAATDWVKVKSVAWRAANAERWRLFERAIPRRAKPAHAEKLGLPAGLEAEHFRHAEGVD